MPDLKIAADECFQRVGPLAILRSADKSKWRAKLHKAVSNAQRGKILRGWSSGLAWQVGSVLPSPVGTPRQKSMPIDKARRVNAELQNKPGFVTQVRQSRSSTMLVAAAEVDRRLSRRGTFQTPFLLGTPRHRQCPRPKRFRVQSPAFYCLPTIGWTWDRGYSGAGPVL